MNRKTINEAKLDRVVAEARSQRDQREQGYRARALKMYPWICGRCTREFTDANVHELTVHHRDHNHDSNPEDGSNWELLCLFCHDNEHQRQVEQHGSAQSDASADRATHQPFSALAGLLNKDQ
jgi:hypothetical protein